MSDRILVVSDIDGTLIDAGGAGGQEIYPEQAVVVGDAPFDVRSAHGAGMVCIGVGSDHFDAVS